MPTWSQKPRSQFYALSETIFKMSVSAFQVALAVGVLLVILSIALQLPGSRTQAQSSRNV